MILREAAEPERESVLALIRTVPELPQWTLADLAGDAGAADSGLRRRLLVALDGDRLLGFAQTAALTNEAELEGMAVEAGSRGRGVGAWLLRYTMEAAQADGAEIFRLEVRYSNVAARHLYETAGMAVVGLRRGYYRDPVEDAVLMEVRWKRDLPTV